MKRQIVHLLMGLILLPLSVCSVAQCQFHIQQHTVQPVQVSDCHELPEQGGTIMWSADCMDLELLKGYADTSRQGEKADKHLKLQDLTSLWSPVIGAVRAVRAPPGRFRFNLPPQAVFLTTLRLRL